MASASLSAKAREERGKGPARELRRQGRIPAVIYGRGEETRAISLDSHEFERLAAKVSLDNTILTLQIGDGRGAEVRALVREVQTHPYRPQVVHVDFYQIHANEPVDVTIPIHLTGTAAGVREGGMLQVVMHDLPVRCLPDRIPESIEADVSSLTIGDSLHISDLAVPEGVEVRADSEQTVCSVQPPAVATLEEPAAEAAAASAAEPEPEVITRRAKESEEE
jgi:large subunit ribosomal protein L25